MAEIINLDKIRPDDKIIEINGKEYKIPGSTPVKIMFDILKNSQKLQTNPTDIETTEKAFKSLYELFKIRQPDLIYDDFAMLIGFNEYIMITNFLFSGITPEETQKKIDNNLQQNKIDEKKNPEIGEIISTE